MNKLEDLMIAVQSGEVDVADLSEQEQEIVLEGYQQLAEHLSANPEFSELAKNISDILNMVEEDPFEDQIQLAEQRGCTYWEIESDHIH